MTDLSEEIEEGILQQLAEEGSLRDKKLRKGVLKKYGAAVDETHMEAFKNGLQKLIDQRKILEHNGEISLNKALASTKRKNIDIVEVDKKSNKKSKPVESEAVAGEKVFNYVDMWKNGEKYWKEGTFDPEYLRTNPERITRLFCGNLNKAITEEDLKSCLPGITFIKWITDKSTGEFYGSSFIEMKDPEASAKAVMQDGSKFMGRPLKIYYCPPRPGDTWPPVEGHQRKPGSAGGKGGATSGNRREKTAKPEGCRKLFVGNLAYDIDDDSMVAFFESCGTMTGLRWLTHKDSGEFRGSGYVEFSSTEEAEKAMLLDGKELLGRNIRLDWTT